MKRGNILGIALVGALMAILSVKALITGTMEVSRYPKWQWHNSTSDVTITGSDAKVFGLVGLAMSLIVLGACLGLWVSRKRE